MRDEETGSYWQQITGTAIAGPLKGRKLTLVPQDETRVCALEEGTTERDDSGALAALRRKVRKGNVGDRIRETPDGDSCAEGNAS